ncbi:MAG: c-type cytochrome biogenesis protein CcsB [Deltaproteobacteria bacterium]|nr:c-type cytochrome biogenesis protein CcsB [Deltaproteobacteria bacterium]MBW2218154.1 c-type cytochrome biogenesis protein CcsB [Deltaproteobacteria bacterium]
MNSSLLLSITTFVFGFAAVLYVSASVFKKKLPARLAWWITLIAVLFNAAGIVMRWIESYRLGIGHAPLSNMYESLVFFSFTLGCIHMIYEKKYQNPAIGTFAAPIAFLAMAYASLAPGVSNHIQPLIPALKSNWLIAHVVTCFLGYAGFAIAFGISILYLASQQNSGGGKDTPSFFPSHNILEELTHQMVMFGFLFLTIGIITGSVWANSAWGSYWSWDPKETWSLITWFIYATLLHARMMRGWHGRRIAWLSIIGFTAVLFTYFGVNYLPGLHSYAQS